MRSTFYIAIIIFSTLLISRCDMHKSDKNTLQNNREPDILAQIFKTNNGWGYSVLVNDKLFIRQEMIPVVAGIRSFANAEDAQRVADLVVLKLKHHQKPILKLQELQRLGIVKS